jgi:hypothetical protein
MDRTQRLVLDHATELRRFAQLARDSAGATRRQNTEMRARLAVQRARAKELRDQQPQPADRPSAARLPR